MKLITNSAVKLARLCPRKYKHKYIDGIVPLSVSEDLDFGTVWHKAQEAWWLTRRHTTVAPLDAALAVIQASTLEEFAKVRAVVMMTGYHYRWENEPYSAVVVEGEFQSSLVNPDTGKASKTWRLAGKLDLIVRSTIDHTYWIVEHKTSSEDVSPGSVYHQRLRMDSQASTYYDGAKALGYSDITGCIYDVAGKLALRPLKATPVDARKYVAKTGLLYANQREADETAAAYQTRCMQAIIDEPERYYSRLDVPRSESELQEARRDLWLQAQRIHEDEALSRHPRNPDACMAFGRPCEYLGVCSGLSNLEDEGQFRRLTSAHQELSGVPLSPAERKIERGSP